MVQNISFIKLNIGFIKVEEIRFHGLGKNGWNFNLLWFNKNEPQYLKNIHFWETFAKAPGNKESWLVLQGTADRKYSEKQVF